MTKISGEVMTLSIKSTSSKNGSSSDYSIIAQINALIAQYPQIKDKLPAPGSMPPQQVLQLAQTLITSISNDNYQSQSNNTNNNSINLAFNTAYKTNESLGKKLNLLC